MKHRTWIGPKGAKMQTLCGHPMGSGHTIAGFRWDVTCPDCKDIQSVHGWRNGIRPAEKETGASGDDQG